MDKQALSAQIKNLAGEYLKSQGVQLVELIYRHEGQNLFLRFIVDKPEGGITLDECAYLNNRISAMLDETDLMQFRYILEVSSPGLDRPLTTKEDFLRCKGRQVRFFLRQEINGRREIEGTIKDAKDDSVDIQARGLDVTIPLPDITKAKQIIDA
ncbi:MAG: ribosome maturation factor RimP [Candidatus Omnitrophica bacterium]|nr:ribosome maturation factor RimP [Candidatus Omnitrophota bacterium]